MLPSGEGRGAHTPRRNRAGLFRFEGADSYPPPPDADCANGRVSACTQEVLASAGPVSASGVGDDRREVWMAGTCREPSRATGRSSIALRHAG